MIFLPKGRRARFCAARLPCSGEPSSTIRPGGKLRVRGRVLSNSFKITKPPRLWPTKCSVSARLRSGTSPVPRALSLASASTDG